MIETITTQTQWNTRAWQQKRDPVTTVLLTHFRTECYTLIAFDERVTFWLQPTRSLPCVQWRTVGFWRPGQEVKLAPFCLIPPPQKKSKW